MFKLKHRDILKRVESEGFESVWLDSSSLLPKPTSRLRIDQQGRGLSHPLPDLIQKMRESFLNLGFTEVFNPIIVDETEVYKQYGPEAAAILDRCYYLATLPRPDVGLSKEKCRQIECLGVQLNDGKTAALRALLRKYKKGEIASDDLVEKTADALQTDDSKATRILFEVFPEFSDLKPVASSLTLRSHITSSWFLTLEALQHKSELPLKLFSVGIRFRREPSEDSTHLRVHHAASCVVMDKETDVKDGEEITKASLKPVGLEHFRFVQKTTTSKYYAPKTEYEGYVFHPATKQWIEVVDFGLYSPIALAKYGLEHPVLNVGIGLERIASILQGIDDIRQLVYPQFYAELSLSDAEIVKMIEPDAKPTTDLGLRILEAIKSTAIKHANALAPCEFLAFEGENQHGKVKIYVYETETGAKLLGPAALNRLCVYDGNVLGVPEKRMENDDMIEKAREKGCPVGFSYLDAIASLAAARVEESLGLGRDDVDVQVTMAKHPSDINIRIGQAARQYITMNKKRIKTSGPVFVRFRAEIVHRK